MAKYYFQDIHDVTHPQKPPLGPLAGGKLAKVSRIRGAFRGQDKVPALGRRVLCSQSLRGESTWLVPDTDPDAVSQTHPTAVDERPVARAYVNVTPGHFLSVSVLCVPCGATQVNIGAGDWDPAGVQGSIGINVTWTDQASTTESHSYTVALPASPLPLGAAPADPWAAMQVRKIVIAPPAIGTSAKLDQWTSHVTADIELFNLGGCRIVDAVVVERPWQVTREADDTSDFWTSHLWASPDPDATYPDSTWPWQRLSETTPDGDPRGGTWHLMDVAAAQGLRLGPQLIGWTAYDEGTATVTDTDVPVVQTTSSTFVRMTDGAATGYSDSGPGWSIATAAYARNREECHTYWSDRNGSIPVIAAVWGGGDGTTGTVRFQASKYSYLDVAVTAGSNAWNFAYGHLRCGIGPGDPSLVTALFKRDSGANTLDVGAVSVFRADQYAQP